MTIGGCVAWVFGATRSGWAKLTTKKSNALRPAMPTAAKISAPTPTNEVNCQRPISGKALMVAVARCTEVEPSTAARRSCSGRVNCWLRQRGWLCKRTCTVASSRWPGCKVATFFAPTLLPGSVTVKWQCCSRSCAVRRTARAWLLRLITGNVRVVAGCHHESVALCGWSWPMRKSL